MTFLIMDTPTHQCGPTTALVNTDDLPKGPIGQAAWSGQQLANAAVIINVGHEMGLTLTDQTVGVMTAMGESSLTVLDRGDAAGPDSRGLFQQRDNGAWGTYEERMDPASSARMFFEALDKISGPLREVTDARSASLLAHNVQINADAYHYAPYWKDAVAVVEELSEVAATAVSVNAQECTPLGVGGEPQISADCEPVRAGGALSSGACGIYAAMMSEWGPFLQTHGVGCLRDYDDGGDHPHGYACDYMVAQGGSYPTPEDHQQTLAIVQWLMDHHEALKIKYIIYDEAIWSPSRDRYGPWAQVKRADHHYSRAYFLEQGMCEWARSGRGQAGVEACAITNAHIDHIHVSNY
ncbi:hypothetical protein ACWFMI_27045 [Nocardiopsis terrae]